MTGGGAEKRGAQKMTREEGEERECEREREK